MDNYNCTCCNYTTIKKQTYERHLLSVKHLKKTNDMGNKRENHAEMNKRLLEYIKDSEASREEEMLKARQKDLEYIAELKEVIKNYAIQCRILTDMNKQLNDRVIELTKKFEKYNVIV